VFLSVLFYQGTGDIDGTLVSLNKIFSIFTCGPFGTGSFETFSA
jgi:hypothetical protein